MISFLENLSGGWINWIGTASWQLALFVIIVGFVVALARSLPPKWRYAIWFLVVVKVFLPPSIGTSWGVGNWGIDPVRGWISSLSQNRMGVVESVSKAPDTSTASPPIVSKSRDHETPVSVPLTPSSMQEKPSKYSQTVAAPARQTLSLSSLLFIAWLAGVAGFIGFVLVRYFWLCRILKLARSVDEGPLRVDLERQALKLGGSNPPELVLSDRVSSPFLCGFFRQKIVLPANLPDKLSREELNNVLLHELMHWIRRDVYLGWVQLLAQGLFWFHPFVWAANSRVRHERECACDEAAIALDRCNPKDYGEALLKVLLASEGRLSNSLGFLGIFERNTRLRGRLESIMSRKGKRRLPGLLGWGFLVLFALVFLPMARVGGTGLVPGDYLPRVVRIVLGDNELAFEGERVTLEELPESLALVENPGDITISFAVAMEGFDPDNIRSLIEDIRKTARELGFKGVREDLIHPLDSYGVDDSPYSGLLKKKVSMNLSSGSGGLSIEDAVKAACHEAGIPYVGKKSERLSEPGRRRYIDPVQIKDQTVERVLLDLLNPEGLRFNLEEKGLYLYYHGKFKAIEATTTKLAGTIKVPARTAPGGEWLKMEITVTNGDLLSFKATGEISWDPRLPRVSPDGNGTIPRRRLGRPEQFLMPDGSCGGLIGKIGEGGDPFFIGKESEIKAKRSGPLFLSINDRADYFGDNDGFFLVNLNTGGRDAASSREPETGAPAPSGHYIQDLIDKAEPGGVVEIPPGVHPGLLKITKPLMLLGKSPDECTIEIMGDDPAIAIHGAGNVTLENLKIRWSPRSTGKRLEEPAAVSVRDTDKVILKSCRLEPLDRPKQTPYGLLAAGRSFVSFTDGTSEGFSYTLMFTNGANGEVKNSFLSDAGHSVVTLHQYSKVLIENNILARCGYHAVRNTGGVMEMRGNLVVENKRSGAYLGNKSAHGRIVNNLFLSNQSGIVGFSQSDVRIENNIFLNGKIEGIGFRNSCNLQIGRNIFCGNPLGLVCYLRDPAGIGANADGNHYWNNEQDVKDFEKAENAGSGDPAFTNAENGDFSLSSKTAVNGEEGSRAGLVDPEQIRLLVGTWLDTYGDRRLLRPAPPKSKGLPEETFVLSYVDDTSEGKRSMGASGHAMFFETSGPRFVEAVEIFASRYGHEKPPEEDFHLFLLNEEKQVLADIRYPYSMIKRGEMKWYFLRTPSVEVPKRFYAALSFNPHKTKGIYLGFDGSPTKSHSFKGLPDSGYEPVGETWDWMIRVHLLEEPTGEKGVKKLADWNPPRKDDPFVGCIAVEHDTGVTDDRMSYGGSGPAIRIDLTKPLLSDHPLALRGIRLYASRYGSGYIPDQTFLHIFVLDSRDHVIHKERFPYGLFGYRAGWVDLPFLKPFSLSEDMGEITVALDPEAHSHKGIYFHYNKNPGKSHSRLGNIEDGFRDIADKEWIIRAFFQLGEGVVAHDVEAAK